MLGQSQRQADRPRIAFPVSSDGSSSSSPYQAADRSAYVQWWAAYAHTFVPNKSERTRDSETEA